MKRPVRFLMGADLPRFLPYVLHTAERVLTNQNTANLEKSNLFVRKLILLWDILQVLLSINFWRYFRKRSN
jgi:hypothetical protein